MPHVSPGRQTLLPQPQSPNPHDAFPDESHWAAVLQRHTASYAPAMPQLRPLPLGPSCVQSLKQLPHFEGLGGVSQPLSGEGVEQSAGPTLQNGLQDPHEHSRAITPLVEHTLPQPPQCFGLENV
jgi:hypothetical protein